jgi:fibronectin type 3 domain-containing protein
MIKFKRGCYLYLIAILLAEAFWAGTAAAATGPNVLINAGFERSSVTGFFGWTNTSVDGAVAEPDSTVFRSGAKSVKFTTIANGKAELSSSKIPVSQGETVSFHIWYKTALTTSGSEYLFVRGINSAGVESELKRVFEDVQPAEWKELGFSGLVIPAGIAQIYLRFMTARSCVGSIWIDDCELQFEGEPDTIPSSPAAFQAERRSETSAGLSWSAPGGTPPVGGYRIYRAEGYAVSPDPASALADVAASASDYVDSSIEAGRFYSYLVTARGNLRAESLPSNIRTISDEVRYSENLIKNGDFQLTANDKYGVFAKDWTRDVGGVNCSLDDSIGHSEAPALKLEGNTQTREIVTQAIAVKPNTKYFLSVMVRGSGLSKNAEVAIIEGAVATTFFKKSGTFGWEKSTAEYTTGAETQEVKFRALLPQHAEMTGTFWIDDVTMFESAVGVLPLAPENLTARRINHSEQVELSWEESVPVSENSWIAAYRIYRGQAGHEAALCGTTAGDGLTWMDPAADHDKQYYYYVLAVDNTNTASPPSVQAEVSSMSSITATVKGQVSAAETGLSGASVSLTGREAVTTDANGVFTLDKLIAGEYTLTISCKGFLTKTEGPVTLESEEAKSLPDIVLQRDEAPPQMPANLVVTPGVGYLDLGWEVTDGTGKEPDGFYIYRGAELNGLGFGEPLAKLAARSYRDVTAVFGQQYYYAVAAYVEGYNNAEFITELLYSEGSYAAGIPMQPIPIGPSLQTPVLEDEAAVFSWQTIEDDEVDHYLLELSSAEDFSGAGSFTTAAPEHHHTELLQNGTWYWRVRAAYKSGVMGPWSETTEFQCLKNDDLNIAYVYIQPRIFSPGSGEMTISYVVHEPSLVEIKIYTLAGDLMRELLKEERPAGTGKVLWNGTDRAGKQFPNGMYVVSIAVKPSGKVGSRTLERIAIFK